jgi:AAA+ ATPase superfamily predicted ATPase
MWDLNGEGAWPFHFTKLGSYWDSNTEIDITALDPEGKNLILGECKYWKDPVGLSVLRDLEEKAKAVSWERDHRKVWYVLFSANGFTEELQQEATSRDNLILCTE